MLNQLSAADLRSLRVFAQIAEAGSLSACQERLNLSPSTISIQLSTLEQRLGYRLCDRGRAGFCLTTQGALVLNEYKQLKSAMDHFRNRVNDLSDQIVGKLRLGLLDHTLTEAAFPITEVTRRFLERAPNAQIEITHDVQTSLRNSIIEDRLDLAIGVFDTQSKLITSYKMHSEKQNIYCGRNHPFYPMQQTEISRENLEHSNWVLSGYTVGPHTNLPIKPIHSTATAANIEGVCILIQAGQHVGYLPEHFAAPLEKKGDIKKIECEGSALQLDFYLIVRTGREENAVVRAFMQSVEDIKHNTNRNNNE